MNNQIKLFTKEIFGNVRATVIKGEVYFFGEDVVEALDYVKNYTDVIKQHCKQSDYIYATKETHHYFGDEFDYKELGQRGGYLVNQYGVIRLVMGSTKPQAEQFEEWVVKEVIPSVLETGEYSTKSSKAMTFQDHAKLEMQMWDMTSTMLRLGDRDKLKGIETVYNNYGINTNVLPKLKQDDKGDLRSMTELLKRYEHTYDGKKLSATKANELLIEHGYLENRTRPSTSGKGTYKSLLPKAQGIYGENINNTHGSSQQTSPEWYENKFCELMKLIGATLKEKKVA